MLVNGQGTKLRGGRQAVALYVVHGYCEREEMEADIEQRTRTPEAPYNPQSNQRDHATDPKHFHAIGCLCI
jgi:hypothetical protein